MSGGSYYNYRKTINKKVKKEKDKKDQDEDKKDQDEDNKEEDIILPTDEEQTNNTYVN